jgi:acetyl-CoA/propionyl-CoA carboxylase biotin carboxyl carrier protein
VFDAVLIANRGEIAVRVIRACRELGVRSVAVYSEVDRDAPHVRAADEAHLLGPAPAAESYLHIEKVLEVAAEAGVDAIHPGYGFLSENADFARAVADAGFTFVGPPPDAIASMGDKLTARGVAEAAGVAVVPGTAEPTDDPEVARAFGDEHGYPVAVKAMFGGGGRGMKVVRSAEEMAEALEAAQREATASFGRGECYLERYLEKPRHVEIQVLGDLDGTVIHLGERDCSLQRRHQKVVEEAPAPNISPAVREAMGAAAIKVAVEMGYHNAGTCEFLLDSDNETFYFLEMNTRLQVEHPVTELVTGVDLVHAQLRIAAGDGMGLVQDDVSLTGHAIELRLNAEDPAIGWVPSPGLITAFTPPLGPWVRLDSIAEPGYAIPQAYDSMFGKLIVWGADRDVARARMVRAIDEMVVEGIPSTAAFGRLAMQHEQFAAGQHSTMSIEREWDLSSLAPHGPAAAATADDGEPRDVTVEVDGRRLAVRIYGDAPVVAAGAGAPSADKPTRGSSGSGSGGGSSSEDLLAPMQGTLVKYAVAEGDAVSTGDLVAVLEAMKMENNIVAHRDGTVAPLPHSPGDSIDSGAVIATIT